MATDSTAMEVLTKRGDVILHVGKAPQTERKLLVSSVLLSHISPVFAVMFDGRFAEGQALTPALPRVVPLPEDDADSMAVVCKIIHAVSTDLSVTSTPTELANIAMICHKYDCVDAVRAWGIIWVEDILRRPKAADFEKTLVATYLLDLAPEFLKTSKSLIRDRSDVLSIFAMSNDQDFLPLRLLDRLVKEQYETQKRAWVALDPIVPVDSNLCGPAKQSIGIFFTELRKTRVWPLNTLSIAELKIRLAVMPDIGFTQGCNSYRCVCRSSSALNAKAMLECVTKVYNGVKGVCLDCVKRKELGENRSTCRATCVGDNLTYV